MILVTGGAGYIGSHFVLACQDRKRAVVVLDDLSTGFRDAVPPDIPFVHGDCGDQELLEKITKIYGITAVVHFAGKVVVPESVSDPLGYYETNTTKTRKLLAHCIEFGIRNIVFSSTAAVYGSPLCQSVAEVAPTLPMSPYGRSKLMVEWMLSDAAAAHDLCYVALRYFNVAGADPEGRAGLRSPNATHLLKRVCEVAVGSRPFIDVYGNDYDTPDGTCIRDFIHVSDLAEAHLHAIDYLAYEKSSIILNCGYGVGTSVQQAITATSEQIGRPLPFRVRDRRVGDIPAIISDTALLDRTFNWEPRYNNLETLLDTAIKYEEQLTMNVNNVAYRER